MRGLDSHVLLLSLALSLMIATPSLAQESKFGADFRRERERFGEKCGDFTAKKVIDCAAALVTDHPIHLAVGSLAPQNGLGFGVALVAPQLKPNDTWRINWSADAVGTPFAAWRTGAYLKFVRTNVGEVVVTGPGGGTPAGEALPRPYPTISAYGQVTSLPNLFYYGLGNDTALDGRAAFAMRQSTIGTSVVWPIGRGAFFNRLNPMALGELNGRWVTISESTADSARSIETAYSDTTAPGLSAQPAMVQFGEGIRIAPSIGRLQLTYSGLWQQFADSSDSSSSFRRWTVDLRHDWSLWSTTRSSGEREHNSPNECANAVDRTIGEYGCPEPTLVTTNRVGTVGFRALLSRSGVSDGSAVPFYFQRTIGGSDIDGERLLASYDDYRFRAPNLMVFQETVEHVLWGPLGAFAAAEQGRVALIDDSLTDGDLKKTFGAGLTLRAGGVPLITAWWATGGGEGYHLALRMNASLFGGSSRPSLR